MSNNTNIKDLLDTYQAIKDAINECPINHNLDDKTQENIIAYVLDQLYFTNEEISQVINNQNENITQMLIDIKNKKEKQKNITLLIEYILANYETYIINDYNINKEIQKNVRTIRKAIDTIMEITKQFASYYCIPVFKLLKPTKFNSELKQKKYDIIRKKYLSLLIKHPKLNIQDVAYALKIKENELLNEIDNYENIIKYDITEKEEFATIKKYIIGG